MRVLFDQGVPVPLRKLLAGHVVETAYERGWSRLADGELLAEAQRAGFDVLVTTDQGLPRQQPLAKLRLGVVILGTTSWPRLRTRAVEVEVAIRQASPGVAVVVEA
jgi:predicted nuclease of predicted toxin-antitoxin system